MNVKQEFATEEYIQSFNIDDRIDNLEGSGNLTLEEREELENLKQFKSEAIDCLGEDEWGYGLNFVRDDYFIEHARELAEDIGATALNEWPIRHIDWRQAADELKFDYQLMSPLFGVEYWVRP